MRRFGILAILLGAGIGLSGLAKGPGMSGGVAFKFGPDLAASDWRYMSFPRRPGVAFTARGEDTVIVETNAGVGVLWHPVPPKVSKASKARWRWRVTNGGPNGPHQEGRRRRTLAVYFAFTDEKVTVEDIDLMDLLRRQRGDVLMYVWGGGVKPGTMLPLPYFNGRGRTVVKRAANTKNGVWFDEKVDFRRAFGRAPGRLVAIAVSSDADDTGGLNVAAVADLCVM